MLRLALDPDFSRESISMTRKYQQFANRAHIFKDEPPLRMPSPLLRSASIRCTLCDGSTQELCVCNNRQALLRLPLPENTCTITIDALASWGGQGIGLFSCDVL